MCNDLYLLIKIGDSACFWVSVTWFNSSLNFGNSVWCVDLSVTKHSLLLQSCFFIVEGSRWPVQSKLLVNPLEVKHPGNNLPPKQLVKVLHPQEEWKNLIVTGESSFLGCITLLLSVMCHYNLFVLFKLVCILTCIW